MIGMRLLAGWRGLPPAVGRGGALDIVKGEF